MVDIVAPPLSPPPTQLTPVQRSSSLRVSRLHSPDNCESLRRTLERRRTCIPSVGSLFGTGNDDCLKSVAIDDGDQVPNDVEAGLDDAQPGICVIRVGSDNIEIEEGKVKRTMRGPCVIAFHVHWSLLAYNIIQ